MNFTSISKHRSGKLGSLGLLRLLLHVINKIKTNDYNEVAVLAKLSQNNFNYIFKGCFCKLIPSSVFKDMGFKALV